MPWVNEIIPADCIQLAPRPASLNPAMLSTQSMSGISNDPINANRLVISTDDVTVNNGDFLNGWTLEHSYGGSAMMGGRESFAVYSTLIAPSNPANTNRNYVSVTGVCHATTGDGGTINCPLGAIFAFGSRAGAETGAEYLLEVNSYEADVYLAAGSSAWYKAGVTICGVTPDAVRGYMYDCMLGFSNEAGGPLWKDGLLFGPMNGVFPIGQDGTMWRSIGGVCHRALDVSTTGFTAPPILLPNQGAISGLNHAGSGEVVMIYVNAGDHTDISSLTEMYCPSAPVIPYNNARWSASIDEVNNLLHFTVKTSTGATKTGTVPLT